jgi:glycosyltransferase 2 family protein
MKKKWPHLLAAALLSAAILVLFFRNTSLADVRRAFASVAPQSVLLFVLFSLTGTLFRVARYWILLEKRIGLPRLFLITLVQNFSVDLLPARSAALAFYSYFTKKEGVILEDGISSFVLAIFYDALALFFLLAPAALFYSGGRDGFHPLFWGLGLILPISILFIFFSSALLRRLQETVRKTRWKKADSVLTSIGRYLSVHASHTERALLFGLSFMIKLVKYVSVYVLFVGLTGPAVSFHSFYLFCFGIAGAELSSLLPVQGLAGFGTWEAAFAFVATRLHLPTTDPFLIGLVIHLITQAWEYAIGVSAFLIIFLRRKRESGR